MFLPGAVLVLTVLRWVLVVVGVYAFGHALTHRAEVFAAAGKLTKTRWVGITAGGTALIGLVGAVSLLGIVGVVAVLVYLADVHPKVNEIRGHR